MGKRFDFIKKLFVVDYRTFRTDLDPSDMNLTAYGAYEELDGVLKAHREIIGLHSRWLTVSEITQLYDLNEKAYMKECDYIRELWK